MCKRTSRCGRHNQSRLPHRDVAGFRSRDVEQCASPPTNPFVGVNVVQPRPTVFDSESGAFARDLHEEWERARTLNDPPRDVALANGGGGSDDNVLGTVV